MNSSRVPSVLLVDDDALVRQTFGLFFETLGWPHELAESGREGLSKLRDGHFDIVITDLMMPEMDGAVFLAKVREMVPNQRALVITGVDATSRRAELEQAGALSVLQKPVELETLRDAVFNAAELRDDARDWFSRYCVAEKVTYRCATASFAKGYPDLPLLGKLKTLGVIDELQHLKLTLVFQEALANTVEHGNLELQSVWREEIDAQGCDSYSKIKRERLLDGAYASRQVEVESQYRDGKLTIRLLDQGPGFDPGAIVPNPMNPQPAVHGRGISLIQSTMDSVTFARGGRELTMTKKLAGA